MKIFQWCGICSNGENRTGRMVAASSDEVTIKLQSVGILVDSIKKKSLTSAQYADRMIHHRDVSWLLQQWAALLRADISLLNALEMLIQCQTKRKLQQVLRHIHQQLVMGLSLAESLGGYPRYFNSVICQLIQVSELSGNLAETLTQIAKEQEKWVIFRQKVRRAIYYPGFILLVACVTSIIIIKTIIPQFSQLFQQFHAEQPYLTQCIIYTTEHIVPYLSLGLIVCVLFSFLLICLCRHNRVIACWCQYRVYQIPVIGLLCQNVMVIRFTRTLALTITAKLPLLEALQSLRGVMTSMIYRGALNQAIHGMRMGQSLHHALNKTGIFPPLLIQWISLGEASGTLEPMLTRVAQYYEDCLEQWAQHWLVWLEPLLLLILGGIVGLLILGLYLPLFQLGRIL